MSAIHVAITDPARRAAFEKVFGTAVVPVKSATPVPAEVAGLGRQMAYQLDLEAIGPDARARLVEHLAAKFGVEPEAVDATLSEQGLAILAEGCVVSVQMRMLI